MTIDLIPPDLRNKYHWDERAHGLAVLATDFPEQWQDLQDCLRSFRLRRSAIIAKGGNRSLIPIELDGFLQKLGWAFKSFDISVVVDGNSRDTPTHEIDNVKGRVGVEVEWSNKDPFFDRDLNNFRLLHQLGVLSVGVIITRMTELQGLFDSMRAQGLLSPHKLRISETHWDKLIPRVDGGGQGGCPLVLIGIGMNAYDPNA